MVVAISTVVVAGVLQEITDVAQFSYLSCEYRLACGTVKFTDDQHCTV